MEIDHEIISTTILLPSADSREVVVSYMGNYVHKVLINRLVQLAQENVWLSGPSQHDHSCWLGRKESNQRIQTVYKGYQQTTKVAASNKLKPADLDEQIL